MKYTLKLKCLISHVPTLFWPAWALQGLADWSRLRLEYGPSTTAGTAEMMSFCEVRANSQYSWASRPFEIWPIICKTPWGQFNNTIMWTITTQNYCHTWFTGKLHLMNSTGSWKPSLETSVNLLFLHNVKVRPGYCGNHTGASSKTLRRTNGVFKQVLLFSHWATNEAILCSCCFCPTQEIQATHIHIHIHIYTIYIHIHIYKLFLKVNKKLLYQRQRNRGLFHGFHSGGHSCVGFDKENSWDWLQVTGSEVYPFNTALQGVREWKSYINCPPCGEEQPPIQQVLFLKPAWQKENKTYS